MKPLKTLALIAAALPYTAFAENVPQPVQTSELQTVNVTGYPHRKPRLLHHLCHAHHHRPCLVPERNAAIGERDYQDTNQRAGDYQFG